MNVDLSTQYLGLRLRNPLVVAASPLTNELANLERLEQAGAAAAVLISLFQEQIEHETWQLDREHDSRFRSYQESLSYFPDLEEYNTGPDGYLRHVAAAKRVSSIPIIGSLNGTITGNWTRFARLIQDAGADALELNIYHLAADATRSSVDVEQRYLDLAAEVRALVTIPLAVKLGPFFSSLPNMVVKLVEAGVDGIVLFNRFAQPDLNLETLDVGPHLHLSTRDELLLRLRWIAMLRDQTPVSLAVTGGIHTADDVLKMLLVGADATMMASALLKNGPEYVATVLADLNRLMESKGFESLDRIKGLMSQRHCPDPTAFQRAHYMKTVASYTRDVHEESLAPVRSPSGAATTFGMSSEPGSSASPKWPR